MYDVLDDTPVVAALVNVAVQLVADLRAAPGECEARETLENEQVRKDVQAALGFLPLTPGRFPPHVDDDRRVYVHAAGSGGSRVRVFGGLERMCNFSIQFPGVCFRALSNDVHNSCHVDATCLSRRTAACKLVRRCRRIADGLELSFPESECVAILQALVVYHS